MHEHVCKNYKDCALTTNKVNATKMIDGKPSNTRKNTGKEHFETIIDERHTDTIIVKSTDEKCCKDPKAPASLNSHGDTTIDEVVEP